MALDDAPPTIGILTQIEFLFWGVDFRQAMGAFHVHITCQLGQTLGVNERA